MLPKSNLFRVFGVFCLSLVMTVFAFGDTVRLKDGSIIKGKIVSFGGGKFVILIDDGTRQRQMSFTADEVEKIEFDNQTMPVSMVKTSNNNSYEKTPPTVTKNGNNTVITVGSKNQTSSQKQQSPPAVEDDEEIIDDSTDDQSVSQNKRNENIKPIQINVKVLADNTSNGWSNSGWVVKKGQKIKITANGKVSLGNGRYASPTGIATLPDNDKLLKTEPTGGLIAVIGDDNNEFIFIGQSREFTATRDGALFLGVNEGNLNDNTGAFDIVIEIDPTF